MRQNQYDIEVTVDGVNLGTFDKMEGGEADSEDTVYRPGKMAPAISLGGHSTVSAITVSRLRSLQRDDGLEQTLMAKVGKGQVTIIKQPLDVNGGAFGRPLVYTGVLKTVSPPEADSDGDDPALFEIQVTPNGSVG